LVYDINNDVSPEAWLTLYSCYLIGWKLEPKNARGDSGLNERFHSDKNHRRHSHGDSHENADYDTLGFNTTGPTCSDSHENACENARRKAHHILY